MIALPAAFDGKSLFQWYGIKLNAIVSLLSIAMKAFVAFSLGESIGQWKWIAFSRDKRELMDFKRIDQASRGPLGSLHLIWRKEVP